MIIEQARIDVVVFDYSFLMTVLSDAFVYRICWRNKYWTFIFLRAQLKRTKDLLFRGLSD
jgi:hypothetical protein